MFVAVDERQSGVLSLCLLVDILADAIAFATRLVVGANIKIRAVRQEFNNAVVAVVDGAEKAGRRLGTVKALPRQADGGRDGSRK